MEAIGHWLVAELGLASWIVGLFVLPLLAVLLIFGLRELILAVLSRLAGDRIHPAAWRRGTRFLGVLLSVVAVALILGTHATEIATALTPDDRARTEHIIISLLRIVGYTVLLAMLLLGLKRAFQALDTRLESWSTASAGLGFQEVVILDPERATHLAQLALRIVRFGLILLLFYLYIPLVLSGIQATEPFARRVMPFVLQPLAKIGTSIIRYIPNLITVILIMVAFRWALRLFRIFMDAVASGEIALGSFKSAWAEPAHRLIRILVIIFAIVVIYPFLPGSDSNVFKGVSVFLGAVLTFGARSSVNDLIAGLILTYNSTFEVGDRVQFGGTTGDVLRLGTFFTLIQTLDNERVSVANSMAMQAEIVNVSEAAESGGLKLRIPVGIGYDAEWQQVYDLLVAAGTKTTNVRSDPAPTVEQYSLGDYAVTYTLVVALEDPKEKIATRTEILENIQDAFNAAGLEIMTPAVRAIRNSLDPAIPDKYLGDPGPETRFRVDSPRS